MVLTVGNSAKLYCLNWIEDYLQRKGEKISILDLGCGTARNFTGLLKAHPNEIRYVGVEPLAGACREAERNLQGFDAKVVNADGYHIQQKLNEKFDLVVSFSVLEHVYQRELYVRSAKDCLKSGGYILINYDSGHFALGTPRDRVKNVVGPIAARFGVEKYYQSQVMEAEFKQIIQSLGLKIIDDKIFNTRLKSLYKAIPAELQGEYTRHWLEFELWLNQLNIPYDDMQARHFSSRNFILQA